MNLLTVSELVARAIKGTAFVIHVDPSCPGAEPEVPLVRALICVKAGVSEFEPRPLREDKATDLLRAALSLGDLPIWFSVGAPFKVRNVPKEVLHVRAFVNESNHYALEPVTL